MAPVGLDETVAAIVTVTDLACEQHLDGEYAELRNPFAWLVSVNGIPVDARTLPAELQDEARRLGLIPDLNTQRAS